MTKYTNWVKAYILKHKIISGVILIVILYIGYSVYSRLTSTTGINRYVTSKVEKGSIVASVSGTGQVSDVNQIDLKSKASGDVVYVGVSNGQKVSIGTLLVELDASDAQKSVRDAQLSLDTSKLALEKLKIQNSNENINADLVKAYNDGFNNVSSVFVDLTSITSSLNDLLSQSNLSDYEASKVSSLARTLKQKALTSYDVADKSFTDNEKKYVLLSNNSPRTDIKNIIDDTYNTTKLLSDSLKNTLDFVNLMADNSSDSSQFTTDQTTLATYAGTINNDLSTILTAKTNIKNNEDSSQNADIDIQNAELSLTQKQNALQDAKDKLSDYFIRAPFDGTVANLDIKKSDSVSSGTTVASIITPKQLALISLNEVDVAKIKIGQKATLTFDAIPDLTMSGTVTEIDPIGTVSQGVVTYDVKIGFDVIDERIKPSMSVSAAIITDVKQDVLTVPNSAVKSQNGGSYVEMFSAPLPAPTDGLTGSISKIAPNKIPVEIGLSNDSVTEIISGLNEGDEIVSRTITGTTTTTATAPSLFGAPTGGRGGGTGGVRVPAR